MALRPSLNEILDDYIPNRIPPQYNKLKIVICIVVGGIIQQAVHPLVTRLHQQGDHRNRLFPGVEWRPHRRAPIGRPPAGKAATQAIAVELSEGSRNGR